MLFAITQQPLPSGKFADATTLSLAGRHVAFSPGDFLSRLIVDGERYKLLTSPLHVLNRDAQGIELSVTLNVRTLEFSLYRNTNSGLSLYYHQAANGDFFVATNIKELRAAGVTLQEDSSRLPEFFAYCSLTPPATFFKGIFALLAGQRLTYQLSKEGCRRIREDRWLPPRQVKKFKGDEDSIGPATINALGRVLDMMGPTGQETVLALSGGMDSTFLCRLMMDRTTCRESYATSYPFETPENDIETRYATTAAQALGLHHHQYIPSVRQYLRSFLDCIEATETPVHGLQTILLTALYNYGVHPASKIIMNGDGADTIAGLSFQVDLHELDRHIPLESLLGHPRSIDLLWRLNYWTGIGGKLAERLVRRKRLKMPRENMEHLLWKAMRFSDYQWAGDYFGVKPLDLRGSRKEMLDQFGELSFADSGMMLVLFGEINTMQLMWSKAAFAAGRAVFFPFIHESMIEYAAGYDWGTKTREQKYIYRKAMRHLKVPEEIISRPKAHFGIAADRWALPGGIFEPMIRLATKVVDEKLMRSCQVNDDKRARILWNWVGYAIWQRLFIAGEPKAKLMDELNEAMESCGTPHEK